MDTQTFQLVLVAFNAILALMGILFGWFIKGLYSRMEKMEAADDRMAKELHDLAVSMPTNYVRRDAFDRMHDNIFQVLRRIEDKIDGKVDK